MGNTEAILDFGHMMKFFAVSKSRRLAFKTAIDDLVAEGMLIKLKGNRYRLSGGRNAVTGRLSSHRDGYGFVEPDSGGEDIFIPARYMRDNLHGDQVAVRTLANVRTGQREGRILKTIERRLSKLVGRFVKNGNYRYVIPDDQRIQKIIIPIGSEGIAENDQVVVAEISRYPFEGRSAEGKVVEILGWPEDPSVEIETIIRQFDLPHIFPEAVLREAKSIPSLALDPELTGRTDLRRLTTITIDGENARDFDDAVSVRKEAGGVIRLWVSIADVSHYVIPGSFIDKEAYLRGTSIYFPDRCIPMLPEDLSNGICSLNPGEDRLTVTVEMAFDRGGHYREVDFYPSIINSCARLNYIGVKNLLVDSIHNNMNEEFTLLPDLKLMKELAGRLAEMRRIRGSVDFDLPEPEVIIGLQGGVETIIRTERTIAHRIIEEFMLAANESVAVFLDRKNMPCLFRIHEVPEIEKLVEFNKFVESFGYQLKLEGDSVNPSEFQRLISEVSGKTEDKLVNELLLRAMKQARYSAENLGHFGLASARYTHFTSPIRRYPDLVVHRILKQVISGKLNENEVESLVAILPDIAAHSSRRERVAMEAEREIIQLKKIQFMKDKLGEEFDGYINGVTPHGFFVELTEIFVEGMVTVSSLPLDFYRFLESQHSLVGERSKRSYRMGAKVRVKVVRVDVDRKQIDFMISDKNNDGMNEVSQGMTKSLRSLGKGNRLVKPGKRG